MAEALAEVERTKPDVVVVDLTLKTGHGIELIEKLKSRDPELKTLVSSMHDEMLFAERVLRAGAMGYITKQEPPEALVRAIRQVLRGEVYLSPRMTSRLLNRVVAGSPTQDDPVQGFSNRELEVYEMIGQGLTIQQIAVAPASQPENRRNPPREDQAEAQPQEQRRTESPRRPVGARTRLVHHARRRQLGRIQIGVPYRPPCAKDPAWPQCRRTEQGN